MINLSYVEDSPVYLSLISKESNYVSKDKGCSNESINVVYNLLNKYKNYNDQNNNNNDKNNHAEIIENILLLLSNILGEKFVSLVNIKGVEYNNFKEFFIKSILYNKIVEIALNENSNVVIMKYIASLIYNLLKDGKYGKLTEWVTY